MRDESTPRDFWNPFEPTNRDIQRTKVLAGKNPVIAGVITFLFLPLGMIYLSRGVNNLKILLYSSIASFLMGGFIISISSSEAETLKTANKLGNLMGLAGGITIVAENVRCVTLARQRLDSK